MASLFPPADISIQIISPSSASERRITPTWSISHLKTKLLPITGIPPSSQRLWLQSTSSSSSSPTPGGLSISSADEDAATLESFGIARGHVVFVEDLRPEAARPNLTDLSKEDVPKYTLPAEEYEKLPSTVLSWKKNQGLGRFAKDADVKREELVGAHEATARERGLEVGKRCRIGGEDERRGEVGYLGSVEQIPGTGGWWVGVRLDEPVGKNDGSVGGTKYFDAKGSKRGVFVRPERVEVRDFPALDDLEELEEI